MRKVKYSRRRAKFEKWLHDHMLYPPPKLSDVWYEELMKIFECKN